MRKLLILLAACFALPAVAQNNTIKCPAGSGNTATVDGGLVTCACGIGATPQTALYTGSLYSYGSSPFASFNNAFMPAMDVCYNTADGPHNTNPTLITMPTGGNSTSGTDWSMGLWATNGSVGPGAWGLIDGTTLGVHWNVVAPQTQSWPGNAIALNTSVSAGAVNPTLSLNNIAAHYWPTGTPYILCLDVRNQECFPVSSTGNPYSSPFNVTITGTLAYNHTGGAAGVGAPVWAEDSNGQGGPTYPTYYKWTTCDISRAMSYLNGVIGNHQYAIISISGTTTPHSNVIAYGKTLETMAAPEGCGYTSADTTWYVIASEFISPFFDIGLGAYIGTNGLTQTQPAPCSAETWSANLTWPALLGSYGGTDSGVGNATLPNPLTYSSGAVNYTGPSDLVTKGRNLSLPACVPGTVNSCFYTTNADGYIGLSHVDAGSADSSNPCVIQQAWIAGGPHASGQVQAGIGHTANWNQNSTNNGNCGTSAATAFICPNSTVFANTVTLLKAADSSAYALTTSVTPSGGGTLVCSPLGNVVAGVPVICTATANPGYTFSSISTNTCSFTVASNVSSGTMPSSACAEGATFTINSYNFTVALAGSGTTGSSITNTSHCATGTNSLNFATAFTCTAVAGAPNVFTSWTSNCGGSPGISAAYSSTIPVGGCTATANFTAPGPIATVTGNVVMTGNGSIY